ncbi:MAG: addiction module protein [Ideonella sp.]|nr:addiction module protein [Ideonella sp.]
MPAPITLEAQVFGLSPADCSRLLERLVASLGVDARADAEWDELAEARESEVRSERVAAVPLAEAMARLRGRFPG